MEIRKAILDDAYAISHLFRAGIDRWQRMDAQGRVEDLSYEQLKIYDRWLHGGAWMSVETGAIWLNHLLRGSGQPLVAVNSGRVCGYIELYTGQEPDPFNSHLHIGEFITDHHESTRDALLQYLLDHMQNSGRLTVTCNLYDADTLQFYRRYNFTDLIQVQQVNISAQGGNVGFYKVTDHPNPDHRQIDNWAMPIGRSQSARYHWEHLWHNLWQSVPEIAGRRTYRQYFNASGQDAFVYCQQHLYNPRSAEIFCWTPKTVTGQLIAAIRDWTYKQGYRTLSLTVTERIAKMLGTEIEAMPSQSVILARDLAP